jgi:hypothetical protein
MRSIIVIISLFGGDIKGGDIKVNGWLVAILKVGTCSTCVFFCFFLSCFLLFVCLFV